MYGYLVPGTGNIGVGERSSQRFHGNLEPCGIIIILHNDGMTVAVVTILSLEGGDCEVPVWGILPF